MILVAFGTRPELLKIEPLLKHWKSIGYNDFRIWLSYQHEELCIELSKNWEFKEYIIKYPYQDWDSNFNVQDYNIIYEPNRLDNIVFGQLSESNLVFKYNKADYILVQGDTATAFACALSAFHRKIPIIHLEAGLRSYDNENPYPEEFYRRSISMMSSINLCPTRQNMVRLFSENVPGKCFVVGNTIIDPIKNIESLFENKILITMHRRENHAEIKYWFECFESLAEQFPDYEFILPIHKNPEIYKLKSMFKNVKCVDPLNHNDFIDILRRCKYVITDSGGVAEEATWFGKRIFLCRQRTERPEGEQFYIWCKNTNELRKNFMEYMSYNPKTNLKITCPFGEGNSSEKITNILLENSIIKI